MVRRLATITILWTLAACGACTNGGDTRDTSNAGAVATNDSAAVPGAAPSPPEGTVAQSQGQSFEQFWAAFRGAVLAGQKETIASVTRFPFETRGPSDDDPVRRHDRRGFPFLLDSLLGQESGMGDSETTRQLIQRTTTLTDRNVTPGAQQARVGDFVFLRTAGRWWFTRAYTDE